MKIKLLTNGIHRIEGKEDIVSAYLSLCGTIYPTVTSTCRKKIKYRTYIPEIEVVDDNHLPHKRQITGLKWIKGIPAMLSAVWARIVRLTTGNRGTTLEQELMDFYFSEEKRILLGE